jgi:hypothetical protein
VARSFFSRPADGFVSGGAHLAVYLVPVFEGGLVVFDVAAPEARGRWLPWNILAFRGHPYEEAAGLADDWCDGEISDLRLIDVMSSASATGSWELAVVFRAELTAVPAGDRDRHPVRLPPGTIEPVGPFEAVDLERWVDAPAALGLRPGSPGPFLIF